MPPPPPPPVQRLNGWFPWWRLLVFLATLLPILWVGTLLSATLFYLSESTFVAARFSATPNALHYLYTVRVGGRPS